MAEQRTTVARTRLDCPLEVSCFLRNKMPDRLLPPAMGQISCPSTRKLRTFLFTASLVWCQAPSTSIHMLSQDIDDHSARRRVRVRFIDMHPVTPDLASL
eukprot:scaffold1029_cov364-Pinguiococcus_pyrenoidosus.AAC.13